MKRKRKLGVVAQTIDAVGNLAQGIGTLTSAVTDAVYRGKELELQNKKIDNEYKIAKESIASNERIMNRQVDVAQDANNVQREAIRAQTQIANTQAENERRRNERILDQQQQMLDIQKSFADLNATKQKWEQDNDSVRRLLPFVTREIENMTKNQNSDYVLINQILSKYSAAALFFDKAFPNGIPFTDLEKKQIDFTLKYAQNIFTHQQKYARMRAGVEVPLVSINSLITSFSLFSSANENALDQQVKKLECQVSYIQDKSALLYDLISIIKTNPAGVYDFVARLSLYFSLGGVFLDSENSGRISDYYPQKLTGDKNDFQRTATRAVATTDFYGELIKRIKTIEDNPPSLENDCEQRHRVTSQRPANPDWGTINGYKAKNEQAKNRKNQFNAIADRASRAADDLNFCIGCCSSRGERYSGIEYIPGEGPICHGSSTRGGTGCRDCQQRHRNVSNRARDIAGQASRDEHTWWTRYLEGKRQAEDIQRRQAEHDRLVRQAQENIQSCKNAVQRIYDDYWKKEREIYYLKLQGYPNSWFVPQNENDMNIPLRCFRKEINSYNKLRDFVSTCAKICTRVINLAMTKTFEEFVTTQNGRKTPLYSNVQQKIIARNMALGFRRNNGYNTLEVGKKFLDSAREMIEMQKLKPVMNKVQNLITSLINDDNIHIAILVSTYLKKYIKEHNLENTTLYDRQKTEDSNVYTRNEIVLGTPLGVIQNLEQNIVNYFQTLVVTPDETDGSNVPLVDTYNKYNTKLFITISADEEKKFVAFLKEQQKSFIAYANIEELGALKGNLTPMGGYYLIGENKKWLTQTDASRWIHKNPPPPPPTEQSTNDTQQTALEEARSGVIDALSQVQDIQVPTIQDQTELAQVEDQQTIANLSSIAQAQNAQQVQLLPPEALQQLLPTQENTQDTTEVAVKVKNGNNLLNLLLLVGGGFVAYKIMKKKFDK